MPKKNKWTKIQKVVSLPSKRRTDCCLHPKWNEGRRMDSPGEGVWGNRPNYPQSFKGPWGLVWWFKFLKKPRQRRICIHLHFLSKWGFHWVHARNIPRYGGKVRDLKKNPHWGLQSPLEAKVWENPEKSLWATLRLHPV